MASDNPIRQLRDALGWTQTQFASALGMSISMIQNYERGQHPSESSICKMQTLAAEKGFADLGIALVGRQAVVTKVFEPKEAGRRVRVHAGGGVDLTDSFHNMLDVIIESGDPEIIGALESFLRVMRIAVERMA